ncbi:MAG: hypothetical protein JRN26_05535 [Nitrososphaerota archaeon]|jgi:hypothetical protein|nr:hypothetical protein [Nitrososphaerota archaeon]MDG6927187.1 hypothetical protein [Nitrososphaerota archaeon]MDG6930825.1 hypothetical protein [Nitrososphaerota archaeon]MDG6932269.1 hypothetical protein [Nitrososphaerota archaeon]MDG6936326.1 hypothetical protein [Nitrososphaerota archaeon]
MKQKGYLYLKNKLFFDTAVLLKERDILEQSLYVLIDKFDECEINDDRYYWLLGLYFTDESNYQRALFIPYPIIFDYKTRGARLVHKAIDKLDTSHCVSRIWHDMYKIKYRVPDSFVPKTEEEVVQE